MMQEMMKVGRTMGLKVCRLDTLEANIPAQKFYEKQGFIYCGRQHWYADNTGWTDFYLYECCIDDYLRDIC